MRSYLAGIFLLFFSANALAQATGYVTALGYQGYYRPDCWTPMLVHLDSTISTPDDYQIQVHQLDLDKDTVVYAKTVTLGPQAHSDFWVYFIPQPVGNRDDGGGLPNGATAQKREELARVLKVQLYDKGGRTFVATLPVGFAINNLDPARSTVVTGKLARERRLILCVVKDAKPLWTEYTDSVGTVADPEFVIVRPQDLPESVLGYEAVDGIVWFDADATNISAFGAKALEAIQQYVRLGGRLVVCQPKAEADFGRILPFADMLPVVLKDDKGEWAVQTRENADLSPLIRLASGEASVSGKKLPVGYLDKWKKLEKSRKSWEFAHAKAKPDAIWDPADVIAWQDPAAKADGDANKDGNNTEKDKGEKPDKVDKADQPPKPVDPATLETTPYVVRRGYEAGSVVWVAQDLGDSALAGTGKVDAITFGWPHVWDHVFGWKNDTYTRGELKDIEGPDPNRPVTDGRLTQYDGGDAIDLGGALLKGMEHTARGAAYIFLAVVFFIGYWIVAGPGSFAVLSARKRKGLSWLVYAVSALVATALTVGVVKLVLRGSAEVRHISVVKLTPADPAADGTPRFNAVVDSRFGLYIPRDGEQHIELKDHDKEKDPSMVMAAGRVSYVIPFAIHPEHLPDDSGFTDRNKYIVNTDLYGTGKPVAVDVPFRSTLKKLQARWAGTTTAGIDGTPALVERTPVLDKIGKPIPNQFTGPLVGKLTNRTGHHLSDVYIAFNTGGTGDQLLWVPSWPKDAVLDLDAENNGPSTTGLNTAPNGGTGGTPKGSTHPLKADLKAGWAVWWYSQLSRSVSADNIRWDDHEDRFLESFPMMAFYDRIGPQRVTRGMNDRRFELLRRGGRGIDMSQELACGKLVILARGPDQARIPLPLEVEGDVVEGEGVTLYEAALPIDRSALNKPPPPATRPTSQPTTQPAKGNASGNAE